ncbi:unnamed protein product [Protopolystoma xenopodis]|uniref:Uncharacterized protein n=1 Tax=Protopolystoma xenopodis TaxID=117903 RepID=A0A3S5FFW8_9PLAT|nr:unnamed protein product [Protopolystoma xenopodis]
MIPEKFPISTVPYCLSIGFVVPVTGQQYEISSNNAYSPQLSPNGLTARRDFGKWTFILSLIPLGTGTNTCFFVRLGNREPGFASLPMHQTTGLAKLSRLTLDPLDRQAAPVSSNCPLARQPLGQSHSVNQSTKNGHPSFYRHFGIGKSEAKAAQDGANW